jgi:hypothetical protein
MASASITVSTTTAGGGGGGGACLLSPQEVNKIPAQIMKPETLNNLLLILFFIAFIKLERLG